MSRNLDAAIETIDAGLLDAAHDRLQIALVSARALADGLLSDEIAGTKMRHLHGDIDELLAELEVARCAADAIRQATT